MKVKIINNSGYPLPKYETERSAGMDLRIPADFKHTTIQPGAVALINTKIKVEIPEGYEAQIRTRSGLAAKSKIVVLNSPGTIDADYRGEIGVILFNHDNTNHFVLEPGMRIAQMVFAPVAFAEWEEVSELSSTDRGEGGFGSTGIKVEPIDYKNLKWINK